MPQASSWKGFGLRLWVTAAIVMMTMSPVTSMHKEMHQRACKDQKIRKQTERMRPVLREERRKHRSAGSPSLPDQLSNSKILMTSPVLRHRRCLLVGVDDVSADRRACYEFLDERRRAI
jgi:hypothetical protein